MDKKSPFGLKPGQLNRLLAIGTEGDGLATDKNASSESASGADKAPGRLPAWIGRYRILEVLGEGGMGIVYLARQEHPIERTVAVKLIKPGMDSKQVIARFEVERQTLAMLDHPQIAHVLDAGTTEDGRPYFVMEYVKGVSITGYCDQVRMTIEGRLSLFLQVCEAIQYAHRKGIIHRDIKPSNILICVEEGKAAPKVIDFGVAKALAEGLSERTVFTVDGQIIGTPEYMSPEQADLRETDVDTRSDVYSLGVVLYVLLTGALPFDPAAFRTGGIEQIRRTIREEDPKNPSVRLSTLGAEAGKIARDRGTEVETLVRRLQKELEWIPLKAMRKDRTRRYRSAYELADDIRNYLGGLPLLAGPESVLYRVQKFVRRRRALVIAVSAVLVVLVAGIAVSTLFALGQAAARHEADRSRIEAEQARAAAERQTKVAEAVTDFLTGDLLALADPAWTRGRQVTVREVLDAASRRIEGRFAAEPLVEATIRQTVGSAYTELGEYTAAEPHLERAHQLHQKHLRPDDPLAIKSARALGWLYVRQGRQQEAEPLLVATLKASERVLGKDEPTTLACVNSLAVLYVYQGQYGKAEELYLGALAIQGKMWGEEHPSTLSTRHNLATLYDVQKRFQEAETLYRTVLEIKQRLLGWEHPDTLRHMDNLANVLRSQGQYDQATELLLKMWEIRKRVLGEEDPDTLSALHNLAVVYELQRRYQDAEALCARLLDIETRVHGEADPHTLNAMHNCARLHEVQGRYEEAERLYRKTVEIRERGLGARHPDTVKPMNFLITFYEAWGKPEEAQKWRAKLPLIGRFAAFSIIYVDVDATGLNDGSSWANAYINLQDALAAATNGCEIRVAQGIYRPDRGARQISGDRTAAFDVSDGVRIEGGYAGLGAPDPNARDIRAFVTVLSGDLQGNDSRAGSPESLMQDPTRSENSCHVLVSRNTGDGTVIDGLTIMDGNADGCFLTSHCSGGGLYLYRSRMRIIACTFTRNSGGYTILLGPNASTLCGGGGGIYNDQSDPTLIDCMLAGNATDSCGGGVLNEQSNPRLEKCRFDDNCARLSGGAMDNRTSSPVVVRCTFAANRCSEGAAGGMCNRDSHPTVIGCEFSRNSSRANGAAMVNHSSNPTIANCLFLHNTTRGFGGALMNEASHPRLANCTFHANQSVRGGAIYSNCPVTLVNSILWNDTPDEISVKGAFAVVQYCDIQGGWPGPGNISEDPLFAGAPSIDYSLRASSSCIDAGNGVAVGPDVADLDEDGDTTEQIPEDFAGNPRLLGQTVDIGACEFGR